MDKNGSIASYRKDEPEGTQPDIAENGIIEELGYNQGYRRVLKTLGSMCVVMALTSPLQAILIVAFYQLTYGGFWGLTWGWFIASVIFFPQALAVAELCSSMPLNGATYWWTAALAPPKLSRFLAFVSGWTNILCLLTSVAAFAFAVASSFYISITYLHPEWVPTNPQLLGISIALVAVWLGLTFLQLERISFLYMACTVIIVIHTVIYLIALPVTHSIQNKPFASGKQVFGSYENYSAWGPGVAVPFTWFCAAWVNSAWAAPAYMVEGTYDARRSGPKAIVTSYSVTAVIGLLGCVISAFCVTNVESLGTDPTGYPLLTLLYEHWGPRATSAFLLVTTATSAVGGSGTLVAYSFLVAAFARDGGLPLAKWFTYVHPRSNLPIYSVFFMATGGCLLLLFALSSVASEIIYSLAVMALLMTLALPVGLRLIAGSRYQPGPWNLGRYSKPVFAWAFLTQIYLIIMEAFPSAKSITADTFNYNWVVSLGVIGASAITFCIVGDRFQGLDLEALAKARGEVIIPNAQSEQT